MKLLFKTDNPVSMQILCDALDDQGIEWRVDGTFGTAIAPGTTLFTPRLMVEEGQLELAEQVLADLGMSMDNGEGEFNA